MSDRKGAGISRTLLTSYLVHLRWSVAALALICTVHAHDVARGADWRVYGNFTKDGNVYATLYSVPDIVRLPDGLVRVWTEASSVTSADMDKALKDKPFLAVVAGRLRARYVPPVNSVEEINSDQVMHMIVLEEIANEKKVYPTIVMLEEIDCKGLRNRYLAMNLYENGTLTSGTDQPGEWSYIQPQTNDKNLATLVCDARLTAPDNTPVPVR